MDLSEKFGYENRRARESKPLPADFHSQTIPCLDHSVPMNGTSFSSTHISAKVKSASNRQLLGRKLEIRALRCRENLGSERPGYPSLRSETPECDGQWSLRTTSEGNLKINSSIKVASSEAKFAASSYVVQREKDYGSACRLKSCFKSSEFEFRVSRDMAKRSCAFSGWSGQAIDIFPSSGEGASRKERENV